MKRLRSSSPLDFVIAALLALNAFGVFFFWSRFFFHFRVVSWTAELVSSLTCELAGAMLAVIGLFSWFLGQEAADLWVPLSLGALLYGSLQALPQALEGPRGFALLLGVNILLIIAWVAKRTHHAKRSERAASADPGQDGRTLG